MAKKHSMDMSKEKPQKAMLPEGWREFKVTDIAESVSKAGNDMFVVDLEDKETGGFLDVYCVATEGKRWLLKQLLTAVQCPAGEDGKYDWDEEDVVGKSILGQVKNNTEEWIDREGEKRNTEKSKIASFKTLTARPY